jgi:thioredoxin reductase
MEYRPPSVPGIAERFGRSVVHCPFCHGWELRERPLGVLGSGPMAFERALLLRSWSDDVTLLTDGPAELGEEDARTREAIGIEVDERPVAELRGPDGTLTAVAFADGTQRTCGGLLVPVTLHQRSDLAAQLGADAGPPGPVVADALNVDMMHATTADGVFAAGDASAQMPTIQGAIAAGAIAAAGVVRDLMSENGKCALSLTRVVPSGGTSVFVEESPWPQTRRAS